jgi:hypothetical protein
MLSACGKQWLFARVRGDWARGSLCCAACGGLTCLLGDALALQAQSLKHRFSDIYEKITIARTATGSISVNATSK